MKKSNFTDKLKEGVSAQELEEFARKYMTEVTTILALTIAMVSSVFDFFTGPSWTIIFMTFGTIVGIFLPVPVERGLKRFYDFALKQEKMTQLVLGGVKIVVGLFIPFVLFGVIGLLAGTSYHYYLRHAQAISMNKANQPSPHKGEDEHD